MQLVELSLGLEIFKKKSFYFLFKNDSRSQRFQVNSPQKVAQQIPVSKSFSKPFQKNKIDLRDFKSLKFMRDLH